MKRSSSKWRLHQFYYRDTYIRRFLPATALLSPRTLNGMLNRYRSVYIKPDRLHRGSGIMVAQKTPHGYGYAKMRGKTVVRQTRILTIQELNRRIRRDAAPGTNLIQQAIPLAAIQGRPFDIRAMMMRKPHGKWGFFGFFVKVAGRVTFITNLQRSGGSIMTLDEALRRSFRMNPVQIASKKRSLILLSHRISERFQHYKASTNQIGIDFGLDRAGRIWVIEVNFDYPAHHPFAMLPDKSAYWRIKRMQRAIRAARRRTRSRVR
ncbi:YheC/YheD family protein [Marinicrinis sediminis]|uniref:YheC/YheD family protein n=1 Tax=Marinicrinis sediminis TaxID=1652465 RepID=A0ABW5R764_9BACL